ncbi:protein-tyrosine phosphatase family protein [Chloroflexus sp.]|uniref:protein-tyrosine phosphatase family protein n=1 Tax=Chloroflexus sp. TaxID=1904827 RepID=UPI00404B4314
MLPHPNAYLVAERFIAGEYPFPTADDIQRLAGYQAADVTCFIDLTTSSEAWSYAPALPSPMHHQRFSIPDLGLPATPDHMQAILAAIGDQLNRGATVYLHCLGGVGRTGMTVGRWMRIKWRRSPDNSDPSLANGGKGCHASTSS